MIKELTKIANELDARGLSKESDLVDEIIKSASFLDSISKALGFEKDKIDNLEEAEKQKLERRWKAHQAKMRQVMAGRLKEAWLWFNENLFASSTDDQSKFPITIEKDLTIGLGSLNGGDWSLWYDYLNDDTRVIVLPAGTTIKSIDQNLNKAVNMYEPLYFDKWFGGPETTLRSIIPMLKRSIQGNSAGKYKFLLPELKKAASHLDALVKESTNLINKKKSASFIPKKIEPFRVKIMEGRFKGGQGMAVDRYDDGVFGIDLDEPLIVDERETDRGFAMEDQIERIDATDSFEEDISDSAGHREKEVSEGPSLTWVNRGDWGEAKHSLRKHQIFSDPDAEGLDRMEKRDLDAMQNALDQDPESEAGYLVINPWDEADFRMFVQDQMDHPEGKQIAVPLNTFEAEGKRINFFKINDWTNPKGDRFGKVEEDV